MATKKCTWLSELMSVLNLIQMNTSAFYFNLNRECWIFIFYLFFICCVSIKCIFFKKAPCRVVVD